MASATHTNSQLAAWLKGFPRAEVEERIGTLELELASLREAVALYDNFSRSNGPDRGAKEPTGAPQSRPAAIRRALRERGNEPIHPAQIRELLLERGWLVREESKYFYSAMSTMTKRGHLLRLQDGRYMLSQKGMTQTEEDAV
jgi:hypothetical protein